MLDVVCFRSCKVVQPHPSMLLAVLLVTSMCCPAERRAGGPNAPLGTWKRYLDILVGRAPLQIIRPLCHVPGRGIGVRWIVRFDFRPT